MDMQAIREIHTTVIGQEHAMTALQQIVAFHREKLYLTTRNYMPADVEMKKWHTKEFRINYSTVQRYMLLTILIHGYKHFICSMLV
jgi:hypothetical protein